MRHLRPLLVSALFSGLAPVPVGAQSALFGDLRRMLPDILDTTQAVALGDVDGDGDLDALMGNSLQEDRLALNDGSGLFADATSQLPADLGSTSANFLADVDGDGDLDAWIGTFGQDRLYVNDGSGIFADATGQLPVILDSTSGVALGDVDADGDPDAVIGNNPPLDRLFLNDGTGIFNDASAQLPSVLDDTRDVALGDVDGDGDLDVLMGNTGYPDRLFLNNGSGVFTDATAQLPALTDNTRAVALRDLDGDGDLDALIGNNGQDRLYRNAGTGVFTDATAQLPASLDVTYAVALGDVDGDGDLDAWIGNAEFSPGVHDLLYLNDGSAFFTEATGQLPESPVPTSAVALGDVDGDGDLDAWIGNLGFGEWGEERLCLNDGTGFFADVTSPLPAFLDETYAVALGDVDGDGDLDAWIGNQGQDHLHLNGGWGAFTDATAQLPPLSDATTSVALGDVDGDGDLDAYAGNSGQPDRLYANSGGGVFADVTATNLPPGNGGALVAMGDVDRDGDLDAFLANRLLLNGGSGTFADATAQLPVILANTRALALGDVDADGDLDALLGTLATCTITLSCTAQQDHLILNDGSGIFTDATSQLPAILDYTQAVALGDVDGDGDLDALIGNVVSFTSSATGPPDRLLLNDGSGLFTDATSQLPANLNQTSAVALGDLDGDGDLDALVGNLDFASGTGDRLYLNGGSGVFTDATFLLPKVLDFTRALALGDLDGDGDVDAWIGNDGFDRAWLNLTRQLAWRAIPRIGKPLAFDLFGPSSGAFFFGFSLGTASLPLPPFGTLRLDPSSLVFLVGGSLDGDGRASVGFTVPATPALVGLSLYWQGLVASPATFTNLEVTTVSIL